MSLHGDSRLNMPPRKNISSTSLLLLFGILVAVFITCLITANIIAVNLIVGLSLVLPAAIIVFPISYIIGDVLTEVYGFRHARRILWLGFLCNLLVMLAIRSGNYSHRNLSGKSDRPMNKYRVILPGYFSPLSLHT